MIKPALETSWNKNNYIGMITVQSALKKTRRNFATRKGWHLSVVSEANQNLQYFHSCVQTPVYGGKPKESKFLF
jgi:hypothetical protein